MKNIALHTLGCKVNIYETEGMTKQLEEAGYHIVPWEDEADIYIVNTCSVTNMADRKSRQMIHKAKKDHPDAIVIAAGCYVQEKGSQILEDEDIDIIIGNNNKNQIVNAIDKFEKEKNKQEIISKLDTTPSYEDMYHETEDIHTRAFVKIQDGCNMFCSYCIIPYVRGRSRSRMPEDILKEVRNLVSHGYREIVLTGIHISSYGLDLNKGDAVLLLSSIIESIAKIPGVDRLRLGSLEPRIIDADFMERIKKLGNICPHFHLSLQSGSDSVLERMNRHYTSEEYKEKVTLIRKYYPNAAITTDVITGFPGEDEEEFEETIRFVKDIEFYEMHLFPYSKRDKTRAAQMQGQLSQKIKSERVRRLSTIQEEYTHAFRERTIGTMQTILTEKIPVTIDGKLYLTGYTPEYIRVAVPYEEKLKNRLISGEIKGFLDNNMMVFGQIVDIS